MSDTVILNAKCGKCGRLINLPTACGYCPDCKAITFTDGTWMLAPEVTYHDAAAWSRAVVEQNVATAKDDEIASLRAQLAEAQEREVIRLAACSTAALANTPATAADRIGPESPYYSAAYGDVCAAVDREMAERTRRERAERERDEAWALVEEYGRHAEGCSAALGNFRCRCGWTAARAALQGSTLPQDANEPPSGYPPIRTSGEGSEGR